MYTYRGVSRILFIKDRFHLFGNLERGGGRIAPNGCKKDYFESHLILYISDNIIDKKSSIN